MRWVFVILCLFWPTLLAAQCQGQDLRASLTDAQRAEIDSRVADQPYQTGNHWRATRGDRTLYLIGTMHVDDPRMAALAERLAPRIEAADLLMLEADDRAEAALQRDLAKDPGLLFLPGKTLIDLLPPEQWKALSEAAAARGIPGFMAAKMRPWYLSLMLSMSPCDMRGISEGREGLDARLNAIADKAGVPTKSLEDPKAILALFNQGTMEEQLALLALGILPPQAAEDATFTLKQQYFEEETLRSLELSRVVTRAWVDLPGDTFDRVFDDFLDLLLRQRNENWIAPIEAAEGKVIVIAVGALHLAGPHGLPALLEKQGYRLDPLPFW